MKNPKITHYVDLNDNIQSFGEKNFVENEITGRNHNDHLFDGFDWGVAAGVAVMFLLAGVVLVLG